MAHLYPTLEDMKVDQIQQAQMSAAQDELNRQQIGYGGVTSQVASTDVLSSLTFVYPSLMEEYMGLRLEPPSGAIVPAQTISSEVALPPGNVGQLWSAPLSGGDLGMRRGQVTNGIRQVVACKNDRNKVGLRFIDVNKGIFVQFVEINSPAAQVGLRVGDQILQLNGTNLAGVPGDKAMKMLEKADGRQISFAVRDRPFERNVTLHKDSSGHVGFQFKSGRINAIVKDSSAARNGLLTDQQILEVNGQNVIGLKDDKIIEILDGIPQIVTLTIMPSNIFDHMMKNINNSLIKSKMDHSVPEVF